MALNEALQNSQYLLASYVKAAEHWNKFKQTNKKIHLRETLKILCETHRLLERDTVFWLALQKLPSQLEQNQHIVRPLLNDLNRLLSFEYDIATNPNFKDQSAITCTLDMINAAEIVDRFPDSTTIENLRTRASQLSEKICDAQEKVDVDFVRVIRIAGKSLLFILGAGTAILNYISAVAVPPALASVVTGVDLMMKQIPDPEKTKE